ncbi:MAG TPA: hypothetical protein VFR58_18795 [Flavisolibacter sp.]|nr:hypothetical protein [Flavisolibacter sp.]
MRQLFLFCWTGILCLQSIAQPKQALPDSLQETITISKQNKVLSSTIDFLDASISSINAFESLLKKDSYRNKVSSFNNPASADMGFNLQNEIQVALKPILQKSRSVNPAKFSEVVNSIVTNTGQLSAGRLLFSINPVFQSVVGLVGNLASKERHVHKEDLDTFIISISKYFEQFNRLQTSNITLDQKLERLKARLKDIQFDLKEILIDFILLFHPSNTRSGLRQMSNEALLLKYLDKSFIELPVNRPEGTRFRYPTDAIKSLKDIANNLQKIFDEYQNTYYSNYLEIRQILQDAKTLGKSVNAQRIDAAIRELDYLFAESRSSDILSLRLATLFEKLGLLVKWEQA